VGRGVAGGTVDELLPAVFLFEGFARGCWIGRERDEDIFEDSAVRMIECKRPKWKEIDGIRRGDYDIALDMRGIIEVILKLR
jgi:hypothetical protein